MRNKFYIGIALLALIPIMGIESVQAQANKTLSGEVTCPVDGSSIQVLDQRSSRFSYVVNNTGSTDIRIGYLASGTIDLTSANSWVVKAGQAYAESTPGVYIGRVVCMTNSAATTVISFSEAYR